MDESYTENNAFLREGIFLRMPQNRKERKSIKKALKHIPQIQPVFLKKQPAF